VQGLKVQLPKSGKPAPSKGKPPEMQAIVIDNAGNITLNNKAVTLASLESQLAALKAKTPEFPAVVRGDSQTQYQVVMNVVDILGKLNISQIGLATKPAK
jgi:biopolymer transport protein ExbD